MIGFEDVQATANVYGSLLPMTTLIGFLFVFPSLFVSIAVVPFLQATTTVTDSAPLLFVPTTVTAVPPLLFVPTTVTDAALFLQVTSTLTDAATLFTTLGLTMALVSQFGMVVNAAFGFVFGQSGTPTAKPEIIDEEQIAETIGTATNPCPSQGAVCEWVLQTTDTPWLAQLIGQILPLVLYAILILLVALIVVRIAKKLVRTFLEQSIGARHRLYKLIAEDTNKAAKELSDADSVIIEKEHQALAARQSQRAHSISKIVASIVSIVVWSIAIMVILQMFGVHVGPLLASAGIIGVAIGFGSQSLVKDFLTGLFIQFEGQYAVGDWIEAQGVEGEVEHISLRVTQLRDSDGTVYHVPNGSITLVANKSQMWSQAIVDVPVAHDVSHAKATAAIEQAATNFMADKTASGDIITPPRLLGLNDFATTSRAYRVFIKVAPGKQWAVQRRFRHFVLTEFEKQHIAMMATSRISVEQETTDNS